MVKRLEETYQIFDGKKILCKNILIPEKNRYETELFKNMNFVKNSLISNKNVYETENTIYLIKNIVRSQLNTNNEELLRARISKNQIKKILTYQGEKNIYIIAIYNAGDKYIYSVFPTYPLINIKDIVSDTRLLTISPSKLKDLYFSKDLEPYAYLDKKIPYVIFSNSLTINKLINNIEFSKNFHPDYKIISKKTSSKIAIDNDLELPKIILENYLEWSAHDINKLDFSKKNNEFITLSDKTIGDIGEYLVFKLIKYDFEFVKENMNIASEKYKPYWIAKNNYGANRDIEIITDSNVKYIEVKTTRKNSKMFYLSKNELELMKENNSFLFRINLESISEELKKLKNRKDMINLLEEIDLSIIKNKFVKVFNFEELEKQYNINVSNYRVNLKK